MAHVKGNMPLMKGNMALMKDNMALTKGNMVLRHVRKSYMQHCVLLIEHTRLHYGNLTFFIFFRYPTSIASLSFSHDGSILAITSSYMYEMDEMADAPPDNIFIRHVSDQETKPK